MAKTPRSSASGSPAAPRFRTVAISAPATGEEEWRALRDPLVSGWVAQGPRVAEFEGAFSHRHGSRFGVATTSGTTALHLMLAGLGIGPGMEVIVPSFTWVASANAVMYCGARPVLVDVDPKTYNVTPETVAAALTSRTRAVLVVHQFGLCADWDAIAEAARGVILLEDAACATGAAYQGRSAGSLGRAAAFSFHPRKAITTGEGGMVLTNDESLYRHLTVVRGHGVPAPDPKAPFLMPDVEDLGFNYRMTDIQAAMGLVQLGKLDRLIHERQRGADFYDRELAGVSWLRTPQVPEGRTPCWQSYVCRVEGRSRDEVAQALHARGIATRPGTHAVHLLSFYRKHLGLRPADLPHARDAHHETLAIPLHNRMTEDDYGYVVEALRSL